MYFYHIAREQIVKPPACIVGSWSEKFMFLQNIGLINLTRTAHYILDPIICPHFWIGRYVPTKWHPFLRT